MKLIPLLAIVLATILLPSCESKSVAEKEVPDFHALYDAEDFETMFDSGHSELQAAQSKEDFIHFLTVVRGKLGAVKSTSKAGWQSNTMNGVTNVVLTYKTVFENGDGTETFTYRVKDDKATLLGWHIDAPVILAPTTPAPATDSTGGETESPTE